jgi:hypothetical protein
MNACQAVTKWITENILVPVERFITEAREACEEIKTASSIGLAYMRAGKTNPTTRGLQILVSLI